MKLVLGLLLAVCLGIFCRFFDIPLPGPPAIMGAVMAIAMASGYTATDYLLTRRAPQPLHETSHAQAVSTGPQTAS